MSVKEEKVSKLIVPLAGFGTRFLPVTKNYPKEMMHLVDKPVVQHLVEEAVESGIEEIIFVLNFSKEIIVKYFSEYQHPHQRRVYVKTPAAKETLADFYNFLKKIKFHFIKKSVTLGDGHSILLAKSKIRKDEPFAVSMGDLLSEPGTPSLRQLIDVYRKYAFPVISVARVPLEVTSKFGVIAPGKSHGRLHLVKDLIEKPGPKRAPSNIAMTGKYVLTPAIFPYLARQTKSVTSGEVRLADGLKAYCASNALYAYECKGEIHDTGNKLDFLKATVRFGLAHPEFGKEFKKHIRTLQV